jgi:hypothetical protein
MVAVWPKRFRSIAVAAFALLGLPCMAAAQEVYIPEDQQAALFKVASEAGTPEMASVITLYSNVLQYAYPKQFVPVYQASTSSMFMLEFIPYGENVRSNWSEMLTIQAFQGKALQAISAKEFANRVAEGIDKACPTDKIYEDLGEIAVEGATSHRVVFGCGKASTGEVTIAQTIKRNGDLIMVQFARRAGPISDKPQVIDDKQKEYYLSLLNRLTVVDKSKDASK